MTDKNCPNCENYKRRMAIWREEAYKRAGHPLRDPDEYTNLSESDISCILVESGIDVYEGDIYKFVELVEKSFWEKNK